MSKLFSSILVTAISLFLLSWGKTGHQAVGYIAMSHLTPGTQKMIADLLCKETLADISTYPDELYHDSVFASMSPWHYMNVPPDENLEQFKSNVSSQANPNIYTMLQHWEKQLGDTALPKSIRIFALKWIVHLIGDLHQPLHISREEDKGGNLVTCTFDDKPTNLHAVWDTYLIERTHLSAVRLAEDWDHATAEEIHKWQSDSILQWCYESNEYCNRIYHELPDDKNFGDAYYYKYIALIRLRIEQAGIRLAGELNRILDPLAK